MDFCWLRVELEASTLLYLRGDGARMRGLRGGAGPARYNVEQWKQGLCVAELLDQ